MDTEFETLEEIMEDLDTDKDSEYDLYEAYSRFLQPYTAGQDEYTDYLSSLIDLGMNLQPMTEEFTKQYILELEHHIKYIQENTKIVKVKRTIPEQEVEYTDVVWI